RPRSVACGGDFVGCALTAPIAAGDVSCAAVSFEKTVWLMISQRGWGGWPAGREEQASRCRERTGPPRAPRSPLLRATGCERRPPAASFRAVRPTGERSRFREGSAAPSPAGLGGIRPLWRPRTPQGFLVIEDVGSWASQNFGEPSRG